MAELGWGADNTPGAGAVLFTALVYVDVPLEVARDIDKAMDDGTGTTDVGRITGAVQYGGAASPAGHPDSGGPADDTNYLVIIIARQ
ncbi:MAG: hypothetical protein DDT24_00486 [Chloroflexi bacterium]|nr:hypothetical protein [Chloroflexota bacterium]